jgi:hypothetical protein
VVAFGFVCFVGCDYDGRPAHSRTPAPARTFKAATTNKPNKTKTNHVQPKDTKIKLIVTHVTKITKGNYGLRHEPSSLARTLGSWVRIPLKA